MSGRSSLPARPSSTCSSSPTVGCGPCRAAVFVQHGPDCRSPRWGRRLPSAASLDGPLRRPAARRPGRRRRVSSVRRHDRDAPTTLASAELRRAWAPSTPLPVPHRRDVGARAQPRRRPGGSLATRPAAHVGTLDFALRADGLLGPDGAFLASGRRCVPVVMPRSQLPSAGHPRSGLRTSTASMASWFPRRRRQGQRRRSRASSWDRHAGTRRRGDVPPSAVPSVVLLTDGGRAVSVPETRDAHFGTPGAGRTDRRYDRRR